MARTAEDALGSGRAQALRELVAHKAAYQLLRSLLVALPTPTPHDRLRTAGEVFAWLGFGALEFAVSRSGGDVHARHLLGQPAHHGASIDPLTAGFAAAANEVAYDLTPGSISARARADRGTNADCVFALMPASEMFGTRGVVPMAAEDALMVAPASDHSPRIAAATERLRVALRAVRPGEDGRLSALGVPLVRTPEDANSRLVFEMLAVLERERPASVPALGVLLLDAARVDACTTFGGLLQSEAWEEVEAPPGDDPVSVVVGCVSAARASGRGSITIEAFEPRRALVLVSPGSSGSLFGRLIAERALPFVDPTLGGVALAAMDLAHSVRWDAGPTFGVADVELLGARDTFAVEQTHSLCAGDDYDRVVVRPRGAAL